MGEVEKAAAAAAAAAAACYGEWWRVLKDAHRTSHELPNPNPNPNPDPNTAPDASSITMQSWPSSRKASW